MTMISMPAYLSPAQHRLLNKLKNSNVILVRSWDYQEALALGNQRLVATGPDQQTREGVCMGIQITDEGRKYLENYPKDWIKAGFDITDFGANWLDVVFSLDLLFLNQISYSFVWRSRRFPLFFVTQNNPETGEYAGSGQREPQKGFASFIGLEGSEAAVNLAVEIIKLKAESIKEFKPNCRGFI